MATLNEVSSLLQLGAGVGIGLSAFRAPLTIRAGLLSQRLAMERDMLTGIGSKAAQDKLKTLSSIELAFFIQRDSLAKLQSPFMIATVIVAFLNLGGLVWASLDATHVLTTSQVWLLLSISVFYYLLAAGALEFIARLKLGQVSAQLSSLHAVQLCQS